MDETGMQQRARAFVASVDPSNIRNDLSVYVQAAKAKLRKEDLGEGESGYTVTKANGQHVITVNSLEMEERQRFTLCHEIAHIILELPSNHEETPSWSYAKRDINEVMCDIFAAELLMRAAEFGVSFPAAASRYANLAEHPCAFVTMERGVIRYAARSTSLRRAGAWIPPKSPIPEGSVAYRLRASGLSQIEIDEVAQDLWFENWDKALDLWEMARHYHRFDTTVSLLWFPEDDLRQAEFDRLGRRVVDDGGLAELTGELPWPGKRKQR